MKIRLSGMLSGKIVRIRFKRNKQKRQKSQHCQLRLVETVTNYFNKTKTSRLTFSEVKGYDAKPFLNMWSRQVRFICLYFTVGGACSITVIIIESGFDYSSSYPERVCLFFTLCKYTWERNESNNSLSSYG